MNELGLTAIAESRVRLNSAIDWLRSGDRKRESTLLAYVQQIKACVEVLGAEKRFEGVISCLGEMIEHMQMSPADLSRRGMAAKSG